MEAFESFVALALETEVLLGLGEKRAQIVAPATDPEDLGDRDDGHVDYCT